MRHVEVVAPFDDERRIAGRQQRAVVALDGAGQVAVAEAVEHVERVDAARARSAGTGGSAITPPSSAAGVGDLGPQRRRGHRAVAEQQPVQLVERGRPDDGQRHDQLELPTG